MKSQKIKILYIFILVRQWTKSYTGFSELQVCFFICPIHHSLFYFISQLFYKSNIR